MTQHLVKLCVGVDSIDDLRDQVLARLAQMQAAGQTPEQTHTTRMIPQRAEELLDGGSLYWVIKGKIQVRQRLLAIRPFRDGDGIRRCRLVLEPQFVATQWQPRRAFQGWRYLKPQDAPSDLDSEIAGDLPATLRRELAELGLI